MLTGKEYSYTSNNRFRLVNSPDCLSFAKKTHLPTTQCLVIVPLYRSLN